MKQENIIRIDYSDMPKFLKNTAPYIFIDYAEIVPGVSGKGVKLFTYNEKLSNGFFQWNGCIPQIFSLEALIQTAALSLYALKDPFVDFVYMNNLTNTSFFENIFSGDKLETKAEIQRNRRGIINAFGEAFVLRGKKKLKVCSASFQFLIPGILASLSPSK